MTLGGNRFDRSELAGAFGDLGTLVPFVVGYITIARLDPQGVLLGFGLLALGTGFYFRTPMSVQPMKAIATVAVTQPHMVTPGAVFASAVVTGLFWLGMGVSGAVSANAPERRWTLELENEPPAVALLINPKRLAHVFYNIVHNACDAMPNGGKVKLRFKQTDKEVITEIEDTGKGVAPEIEPRAQRR